MLYCKVGLYFRRRQAPHTPSYDAPVRSISRRVPIGDSTRKILFKIMYNNLKQTGNIGPHIKYDNLTCITIPNRV